MIFAKCPHCGNRLDFRAFRRISYAMHTRLREALLAAPRESDVAIARRLGMNPKTVNRTRGTLERLGTIPRRESVADKHARIAEAIAREPGLSDRELASRLGLWRGSVSKVRRGLVGEGDGTGTRIDH